MFSKLLEGVDSALVKKLVVLHTLVIAVSNWLVQFKFDLFPGAELPFFGNFPLAAAAFTFPLVVVGTDLTVRMLGKQTGRAVVAMAIVPAIIASILVIGLGGAPWEKALRIGLASGVAYGVGTMLDVYVFQYIREAFKNNWWLAPAVSTIAANIIDTYTFFAVAFNNSADEYMAANWVEIAGSQVVLKIIVGLVVFLPAYGLLLNRLQKTYKLK